VSERERERRADTRGEAFVAGAFVVSIVGALGLGVVYVLGGQTQLEGIFLFLALGGIGVGLVGWAKRFMPTQEETEERGRLESTEEEVAAFTADFEAGEQALGRRGLLVKLALGAFGALGLALLFPIRSLGPRPGRGLKTTPYAQAPIRVVTEDGRFVRPRELAEGSLATVWPEGHRASADAPTLLIRVDERELNLSDERMGWTVEGIVAYSKLCTHTGCPVGLYQQEEKLLLCPCHQSTFDLGNSGVVVFGPAARSLPQLPITTDAEGYLIARSNFTVPTGPSFFERDSQNDFQEGDD
jgi:ubiquinol-cytochrome c reductase iron-sulfur subunit